MSSRITLSVVVLAAVAIVVSAAQDAAARKRRRPRASIAELTAPLGLQGLSGAGGNVVIPFRVANDRGKRFEVDVQYGYDVDGDGEISDGTDRRRPVEYFRATEDVRDVRSTRTRKQSRKGKLRYIYLGPRAHAFTWRSDADVARSRFPLEQFTHRNDGRLIPDPDNPGRLLMEERAPGMRIRMRVSKHGSRKKRSAWAYTDPFPLDNASRPSAEVFAVVPSAEYVSVVELHYKVFNDDSEDLNGNGVLDVADLEDYDLDGEFEVAPTSLHFDYARLPVDDTLPADLESLDWQPCKPAEVPFGEWLSVPTAPTGVGRENSFPWDAAEALAAGPGDFLIRVTPFSWKRVLGEAAVIAEPVRLGD